MNYLKRYATHATPRPRPELSNYRIGPKRKANERTLAALLDEFQPVRIQGGVRGFWQRYADRIVDLAMSTVIILTGLTYFYLCLIVLLA